MGYKKFLTRQLYEYGNIEDMKGQKKPKTFFHVPKAVEGTGFVIYDRSLFFTPVRIKIFMMIVKRQWSNCSLVELHTNSQYVHLTSLCILSPSGKHEKNRQIRPFDAKYRSGNGIAGGKLRRNFSILDRTENRYRFSRRRKRPLGHIRDGIQQRKNRHQQVTYYEKPQLIALPSPILCLILNNNSDIDKCDSSKMYYTSPF